MARLFYSFCFLLLGSNLFGQLNLKDNAPLANEVLPSANSEGLSLTLAAKKNGLVVIFSCNTCPFVVGSESFPGWENQYNTLFEQAIRQKIGFILVNSNEGKRDGADSFSEMQKHALDNGYKMPYLLDSNSLLANAFGAKTTPHVYFFDENLSLIYHGSIDNIWDKERKETIPYLSNAMLAKNEGNKIKIKQSAPKGCSIKRKQ